MSLKLTDPKVEWKDVIYTFWEAEAKLKARPA